MDPVAWLRRLGGIAALIAALLASFGAPGAGQGGAGTAQRPDAPTATATAAGTASGNARARWIADGAWFRSLVYLYASGDGAIQREALAAGRQAGLSDQQVAAVSADVRAAWVRLMSADPATLGRPGTAPSYAGQSAALGDLRAALRAVAGDRYAALLGATATAYQRASSPQWLQANFALPVRPPLHTFNWGHWALIYATSFQIPGDTSAYVALPDVYLKFSTLGAVGSIPSFYQPYYTPGGAAVRYTVDVQLPGGVAGAYGAPIQDVGPWNEDDNWWDATKTDTTIPASCPAASQRVSASSLASAAVDGICPGPLNYRRVYYYLLYRHYATPFFQPAAYAPMGSFADASAWPTPLPLNCPEASAASVNDDHVACAAPYAGYNANAGSWLREQTYDAPVLNQAGIDLGPGVDAALGWTWPSSGFVLVNTARLP